MPTWVTKEDKDYIENIRTDYIQNPWNSATVIKLPIVIYNKKSMENTIDYIQLQIILFWIVLLLFTIAYIWIKLLNK